MSLTHLGCPSCGGSVALAEGQRLVACRYCGREALAVIPDAIPRYVVALGVDRAGAAAAAREALSGAGLPDRLRSGTVGAAWSLCYVPFYEVTGSRVGTFLHRETLIPRLPLDEDEEGFHVQVSVVPEPRKVERIDTRVLERDFLRIVPACDVGDLGVDQIPLGDLRKERGSVRLEPYDRVSLQARAIVFAPTRPPEHARAAGGSTADGDIRVVEERVKILYYPVWYGRYTYRGRAYTIAVDGLSGGLLAAHAPLSRGRAAAVLSASLALAALPWGRLVHPLAASGRLGARGLPLDLFGAALLFLAGVAALLVALAAWRVLRRGGELRWAGEEGMRVVRSEPQVSGDLWAVLESLVAGGRAPGTRA